MYQVAVSVYPGHSSPGRQLGDDEAEGKGRINREDATMTTASVAFMVSCSDAVSVNRALPAAPKGPLAQQRATMSRGSLWLETSEGSAARAASLGPWA